MEWVWPKGPVHPSIPKLDHVIACPLIVLPPTYTDTHTVAHMHAHRIDMCRIDASVDAIVSASVLFPAQTKVIHHDSIKLRPLAVDE